MIFLIFNMFIPWNNIFVYQEGNINLGDPFGQMNKMYEFNPKVCAALDLELPQNSLGIHLPEINAS